MTKVIIKETNEIKKLDYRTFDSPEEQSGEILSNYDVKYNSDEDAFEMTAEDFAWWSEYFANEELIEEEIAELDIKLDDYEDELPDYQDLQVYKECYQKAVLDIINKVKSEQQ